VTTFVIDASVAIKWVVGESGSDEALSLLSHRLLAPDLLIAECANILWKKVRRDELSPEIALVSAAILARSDIELEPMAALMEAAARLSIVLGHAAYDCFYLALAMVHDCDFITADEVLKRKVDLARLPVRVVLLRDTGQV
jgi:predicted nucleic acid-binding protein